MSPRGPRVRVALVTGPEPWSGAGPAELAVAVDVLRASSTLSVALANGAARIVPLTGTAEAIARRDADPGSLACGERDGRIVPGFDLGNSPSEYTPERVRGRTLYFASTNGSHAMRRVSAPGAGFAAWTLGAFVNATDTLERAAACRTLFIACAGKLGRFSLEDAAFAGWLCVRLEARGAVLETPAARLAARLAPSGADGLRALVEGSSHGRYLRSLGGTFADDVAFCATLDAVGGSRRLGADGRP
jgi:2-phosphosulfolactate phosphatase